MTVGPHSCTHGQANCDKIHSAHQLPVHSIMILSLRRSTPSLQNHLRRSLHLFRCRCTQNCTVHVLTLDELAYHVKKNLCQGSILLVTDCYRSGSIVYQECIEIWTMGCGHNRPPSLSSLSALRGNVLGCIASYRGRFHVVSHLMLCLRQRTREGNPRDGVLTSMIL